MTFPQVLLMNNIPDTSYRNAIVEAAKSQLGSGRREAYDASALPAGTTDRPRAWCGLFALWCLHEAELARDITWQVGGGFVLQHPEAFPRTYDPHPGDLVVETRPPWHHQVTTARHGDLADTIAGNMGPAPGVVGESTVRVSDPRWAFYSIEPVEAVP